MHQSSLYGALKLSGGVCNAGKISFSTSFHSLALREYNDDNFDEVHSPYTQQLKSLVEVISKLLKKNIDLF